METFQAHCPDIECDGCANAIKNSLSRLAGVKNVEVKVTTKNVIVEYDVFQTDENALRERLEQAGFPVQA